MGRSNRLRKVNGGGSTVVETGGRILLKRPQVASEPMRGRNVFDAVNSNSMPEVFSWKSWNLQEFVGKPKKAVTRKLIIAWIFSKENSG